MCRESSVTAEVAEPGWRSPSCPCPGCTDLHGGVLGEVATYLPGRRVTGVRLRERRRHPGPPGPVVGRPDRLHHRRGPGPGGRDRPRHRARRGGGHRRPRRGTEHPVTTHDQQRRGPGLSASTAPRGAPRCGLRHPDLGGDTGVHRGGARLRAVPPAGGRASTLLRRVRALGAPGPSSSPPGAHARRAGPAPGPAVASVLSPIAARPRGTAGRHHTYLSEEQA